MTTRNPIVDINGILQELPAGDTLNIGTVGSVNSGAITNINGMVKGNGIALSAAVAGTDYQVPLVTSIISTNTTVVSNTRNLVNTSGGIITITLPASPATNDRIQFSDYAGTWTTNNATVNPNGLKMFGAIQNLNLNMNNQTITLIYSGTTNGWIRA